MPGEQPNPEGEAEAELEGQGAAPAEAQAKPWWEARGFKTEAEALAAMDESRSSLTKLQEEHAATRRTLEVVMSRPAETAAPKAPETPGYRKYFEGLDVEGAFNSGDVPKFVETLMSAVDRQIAERNQTFYRQQEELREIRKAFYDDNKDLAKHEDLVKYFTQQVVAENPNLVLSDAMKEIAKRTRAKVVAIKAGDSVVLPPGAPSQPKTPLPHTGAGSAGEAPPATPTPEPKAPAHDDVTAEINRRVKLREQRSVLR